MIKLAKVLGIFAVTVGFASSLTQTALADEVPKGTQVLNEMGLPADASQREARSMAKP